jgi:hypothetical protein
MSDNLDRNLQSRIGCHCWGDNNASITGLQATAHVGCRWVRATRPMQMDCLVTDTPGRYDLGKFERSVDLAIEQGMSVMGILDARWGNETGLNVLGCCTPVWEHLDVWTEFVRQVVGHYRDRVKYWEVINEPPFFWWYPTTPGVRLPADNPELRRAPIRHYAELLKASARAIRETDPQAKIIGGAGFADGTFLRRLYEYGCRDAFDIAAVHYLPARHPEAFSAAMRRLRGIMAAHGDADKPLWDTECGPSGAVIGHAVQTPADYESLDNVYRHCFAHEFGLDRYFWFNHTFAEPDAEGRLQPAYRALHTLTRLIGDGVLLASQHIEDEVHLYVFQGCAGPVSVLWATAPATVLLDGVSEAITHLGERVLITPAQKFSGCPLFVLGDLRGRVSVCQTGLRETIITPMKKPVTEPLQVQCPHASSALAINDPAWEQLPWSATRSQIAVPSASSQVSRVSSSVAADLKLAWDEDGLCVRARTFDDRLKDDQPTGLVQFSLRDSDPAVREWGYFTGGWGLTTLFASKTGPRVLRYEHHLLDEYPPGLVRSARFEVARTADGMVFCAHVPWHEIGPFRPSIHEPALMLFTFTRADGMLDVTTEDEPWEWPHNFVDTFIITPPALACWIAFAPRP